MTDPVVLEGHLRYAGDGYEWSGFYLDNLSLESRLGALIQHVDHQYHHWVVSPPWDGEAEPGQPEPWTPVDRDALMRAYEEARAAGSEDAPYVDTLALQADYGRLRITIERLDETQPATVPQDEHERLLTQSLTVHAGIWKALA